MKRLYATALVLALLTTIPAAAETVQERWHRLTGETVQHLKTNQHEQALKNANTLIGEMVAQLGPGQKSAEVFGRTVLYKALALAGLGRTDEAIWWWQSVLEMYPAFANSDLSSFGKAAEVLKRNDLPARNGVARPGKTAKMSAPKVLRRVEPRFPHGAAAFGVTGPITIEVVITKDGRIRSPKIVKALPAATVAYTALDAVRQWKFEPGKMDGQPVDVIFNLKIDYKM